jgi:radical SAM superfamily enzyme YgiQ (UPF0313 family)
VVFTGGCPLRCLYCQNPETWRMRDSRRLSVAEVMTEIERYRRFISGLLGDRADDALLADTDLVGRMRRNSSLTPPAHGSTPASRTDARSASEVTWCAGPWTSTLHPSRAAGSSSSIA